MAISLSTEDKLEYNFYPVSRGQIQFRIKAPNDAHIALTTGPTEDHPLFEVFIGGWGNTKSVIRKNKQKPDVVEVDTPGFLSNDEFRGFLIKWQDGVLTVNKEGDPNPFMTYSDGQLLEITYFGVCTGWGASGEWLIEARCISGYDDGGYSNPAPAPSAPIGHMSGETVYWVDASGGIVPPGAVEGGRDDEPLFVGRARHEGALIPGKVKASHGVCYIPWGGGEHGKPDYEVMCGGRTYWVTVHGANIPPNVIPAGETEDGEPLFIGRVHHEGTLTIGKVQPSHGVLYIPFGGTEVAFPDYEILATN